MRGTLAALRRKYKNKIRITYRHLPLPQLHRFAITAAEASECAAEQGRFWLYHDLVFENLRKLNQQLLLDLGREAGIGDMKKFTRCVTMRKYMGRVSKDVQVAHQLGMNGTPAFFIGRDVGKGKMEGEVLSGALPMKVFVGVIERVLVAGKR